MKTISQDKFSIKTYYVRLDGWRGYSEPIYAVAGANDTGTFSDSPCPTDIAKAELRAIGQLLRKQGIKFRQMVCQSSNVFCIHRYIICMPKDAQAARAIAKEYIANHYTRLAYVAGKEEEVAA